MNFTEISDFTVSPYRIQDISNPDNADNTNAIIAKTEKQKLILLLGYEMYEKLITETSEETPTDDWQKLIDGATFTASDGEVKHFDGLKAALIGFCFHAINADLVSQHSFNGVVDTTANGNTKGSYNQIQRLYNESVNEANKLRDFLIVNESVYGVTKGIEIMKIWFC